jgi:hypothetical protein
MSLVKKFYVMRGFIPGSACLYDFHIGCDLVSPLNKFVKITNTILLTVKVKMKLTIEQPEKSQRDSIRIYSSILTLTWKLKGWVVSATPRPLHSQERSGTRCIGGWVGHGAGLDGWGKPRSTRIRSPNHPAQNSRYTNYAIPVL